MIYVLVYVFVTFLYVPMYMDVNTTMSYVIKLHYAVWVLFHYGYVVMLLCYHGIMLSWCYDVMWVGNQKDDHCKYHNELCYKAPLCGMRVMLLCYHVVMLLSCYDVMWIGTQQHDHCKYHNELWYKAPLCGMLSCCHDVLLLSRYFIINIVSRWIYKSP